MTQVARGKRVETAQKDRGPPFPAFRLNPAVDPESLKTEFAQRRRVQVADFLATECAAALQANLAARHDWRPLAGSESRHGSESIPVPDDPAERRRSDDPLAAFASFMSDGEALQFLRCVTGCEEIGFADAQATAYSPGGFFSAHDGTAAGEERLAGYALDLICEWRSNWGGLMLFQGADGLSIDGVVPRFNTLNLFAVPQVHSVSIVSRAAAFRRCSVTGWLRK